MTDEMRVADVREILDDGSPVGVLQDDDAKFEVARWKHEQVETNFKYDELMSEINWSAVRMKKSRWEEGLDDIYESMQNEEAVADGGEEKAIADMTADEFHVEFDWDHMKDREMARKCHFWICENEDIIFTNDRELVYDDGIWVEDPGRIAKMLQKLLRGHYGNNVKEEFLNGYVRAHTEYRVGWEDMGIRGPKVAVENGLLNLETGEIERDLKPEDYAIMRIPTKWEGLDAEADEFEEFIGKSVEPDGRDRLQEFSGLCLHTNEYPFKKALMLLGGGDNGKGVYEGIMAALLGHDNVSNDDLRDMASGEFGLHRLRHKTANINSDINGGKIKETSMFKKLTGGDRVRVEAKFETPFEMKNPAKMIFAANSIPKVENPDRAFYRRWLFVEFPNRFTNDPDDEFMDADRGLEGRIIENELPGVLAWAVKGYQRLQERGRFTGEKKPEEVRRQWCEYQDTTASFVRNYVTAGDPEVDDVLDHPMRVDTMYDFYKKYIRTTPTAEMSKQKFHRYITAEHQYPDAGTTVSRGAVRDDEDRDTVRVWDGAYIPKEKRKEIREKFSDEA